MTDARSVKAGLDRRRLLTGVALAALAPNFAGAASPADRDPQIEALIARMTPEEKAGQLTVTPDAIRPSMQPFPINPEVAHKAAEAQWADIRAGRVGALFGAVGAAQGREMQKAALASRLGIPLLFGCDVLHGLRTIFPIPLGLASSFDPSLAERTASVAAQEMYASGSHWTYAPMVDVARDQRWGRVAEGSGEDVHLTSAFAAAYVRGFQGAVPSAAGRVLACPKHFAGYGGVLGGMEYNTVEVSERELRETFLPPFKAALDAGALTLMSAFNDVDGVPATANRHLLTGILRGEWGFRGFVVSDYTAVQELVEHGVAADQTDAARLALNAGVDMSMAGGLYVKALPPLMAQDKVAVEAVDEAVRRVLRVKKALGLFDDPFRGTDAALEARTLRTPQALALARDAATKSVVLLKNDGGLLPLRREGLRIALIGPLASDPHQVDGAWSPWPRPGEESVTLEQGVRAALPDPALLMVAKGSEINATLPGGVEAAVAAAKAADVVVLAIGEGQRMSGEAQSRTDILVPAPQQALAEAVAGAGKPVVVVLSHGRALALEGAVRDAPAILAAWFLGSQSGHALADLLFGAASPSGRLPVSFPIRSGQEPYFYNHKSTGRPQHSADEPMFKARYAEVENKALYPFGFGLTYSQAAYGATEVDRPAIGPEEVLVVSAEVRNTGARPLEEVVQLYVHDRVASITRPVRELKGFQRVALNPGEARRVRFELRRSDLEFVGHDLKPVAEPGELDVWVAPSSVEGKPARFRLTA